MVQSERCRIGLGKRPTDCSRVTVMSVCANANRHHHHYSTFLVGLPHWPPAHFADKSPSAVTGRSNTTLGESQIKRTGELSDPTHNISQQKLDATREVLSPAAIAPGLMSNY